MAPGRGHLHDANRSAEPPYISQPLPVLADRYRPFINEFIDSDTVLLDPESLNEKFGDYTNEYVHHEDNSTTGAGAIPARISHYLLFNPWVPGLNRLLMWFLSIATLTLGAILIRARKDYEEGICDASPDLLVLLACLAIIYLPYIFFDEYFGKPIGLRKPMSKARLLFFDLSFVIWYTVNVTLSADNAFDRTARVENVVVQRCLGSNRGLDLAVFVTILLSLVSWILTFSITLLRLVVRIGARGGAGR